MRYDEHCGGGFTHRATTKHSLDDIVADIRPTIKITKYALAKAMAYAKLVEEHKGNVEMAGFLLSSDPSSKDAIIDDVFLPNNQKVSGGSVELDPSDIIQAGREIYALDKRPVGWFHSHVNMGTFHSTTDDCELDKLSVELAPSNIFTLTRESEVTVTGRKGKLVINSNGRERMAIVHKSVRAAKKDVKPFVVILEENIPVSVVRSMVINLRGDTYAEVSVACRCTDCGINTRERWKTFVEVTDPDSEVELTQEELGVMAEEVEERVIVEHRPQSMKYDWGGVSYGKSKYGRYGYGVDENTDDALLNLGYGSDVETTDEATFSVGTTVTHPRFGLGMVVKVKHAGNKDKEVVVVEFANHGTKKILVKLGGMSAVEEIVQ